MSAARENILASLRARRGNSPARIPESGGPGPLPARAQGTQSELVARFITHAREAAAEIRKIPALAALPGAISAWLDEQGLGPRLAAAPAGGLADLDWAAAGLEVRFGPADPDDVVSVTPSVAGIAETGTILVKSGPETPNSLHLLPDNHIVVLDEAAIVGGYEAGLARLQSADNTGLPRAATMITGPSRSSDIERIVQIGVHGPRRLLIFMIDGEKNR